MNDGNREKAKATAAALLKDESFVIKYPALARALKESVEPSEEPGVSSTVLLPGPAAQKPQLPLNPTSSSPAASPPLSGSTSKFPEPTQQASSPVHLAQSHPSRDPQGGEAAETRTGHVTDDALPAAASGIASPTGEPAEKVLHPPVHYMKRLEELQQGYVQIMQHRNSVSLQYELLRKTGRPLTGARLPSAVALSSSPPFMLPSTSARPLVKSVADAWPPGTIEQQQQQQALLQLQRMGATPSAVHPCMPQAVPWIVSAATHSPEAVASAAEAVAGHDGSLAERSAAIHQLRQQLHPHEKPRPTIDPAVLYEKAGIDLAVQHLKDRAERMHAQSREITRALAHKKQQAELEALREKNAHPLLADVTARDGIAVAQAEAARIELRSRDALYHAAYAEDADAELVRLHAERMKDITRIQETNPLPQQCHVTRAVAEGLEDPLEIMAQRNVDFRVQRLSAAAAQLAVSRMLRNLGYSQEREDAVPVRRGEGPAVYKSKFPKAYPELGYANALPVSQQGRRELFRKAQQKDGKVPTFADFVEEETQREAVGELDVFSGPGKQLMLAQQEKRKEDDDWARLCLSKLHSKNMALEEAKSARQEAEEAQRSLERMRRRQEELEAERDAMAQLARRREKEAAQAREEAERQAAAASALVRKAPSRSPTLTVEAAARAGDPARRGASAALSRSRTVSLSRASLSQAARIDEKRLLEAENLQNCEKTIQDSFEVLPPKRLHAAIPQQSRRKGEILNNALAERLPPYRCEEFVFLTPPVETTPEKLKLLYTQMKKVFSSGELGSSEHVQMIYDFSVGCCQEFVRKDPASQVVINTDLVDLLLQQVNESSNSEVVAFCIHILIVARSPHRKTAQYSAFLAVLSKWKHEPAVLTRACLAIDAAAQRAQLEGLASHERKKLLGAGQRLEEGYNDLRRPPSYNEVVQILESKTPKWMPDDASDVDKVFGRVTLHAIISALQDSKGSVVLCAHINEFIATFSYHVTTLADARRRAVELGVIEAIVKSMTACSTDPLMCAFGCRAISRLVYKEPDDSKIYTELLKMRAMTTLLFVMFKHGKEPCLAEDALRCIANCASNERCAAAILERGVNVICKVVSEHSDNMEVVAQGCRCLWLLSSQPGLQAPRAALIDTEVCNRCTAPGAVSLAHCSQTLQCLGP
ncbi:uncharacterized protein LOC34620800 [Cyclospora cayetanensis]|uniref:Uncharacterized protein LOC34620800 n=1 Tax=Cyclospora cayetanensis TaxID=88456 RepID=A0A6P6S591_9EIME|nr:uncharacterized protein LOC34620800 [Cyclospora cayetanensis]